MNLEHTNNLVEVETMSAADVQSQPITWIWKPFIPIGLPSLIIGDGGSGKSICTLAIATVISNGALLPGMDKPFPASNILVQNSENPWSTIIKPRLEMLGADCSRIFSIKDTEKPLTLTDERIEAAIVKHNVKLTILDPVQSLMPSSMSMNRAENIRAMFMHLERVAQRTQSAVILVAHINKGRGKAQHKALGSVDIVNAVVSAMCLGKAEGLDEDVIALAHLKANLTKFAKTRLFRLNEADGFTWLGESDLTPEDILGFKGARSSYDDEDFEIMGKSKLEEAKDFLFDILESGSVPAAEAIETAEDEGISKITLDRARKSIGVKATKIKDCWVWSI